MSEIFIIRQGNNYPLAAFTDEAEARLFKQKFATDCTVQPVKVNPLTNEQLTNLKPFKVRATSSGYVEAQESNYSALKAANQERDLRQDGLMAYLFAESTFDAIGRMQSEIEAWLANPPQEEEE